MVLQYTMNDYNGAIIQPFGDMSLECFALELNRCFLECVNSDVSLMWLTISERRADLISEVISQGFTFHHCNKSKLVLVKVVKLFSHVPDPANHYIGVGGVVLSENREVLLVCERFGNEKGFYKLPGGRLNLKEKIVHGVKREVLEETNINGRFIGISSIAHSSMFKEPLSDVYFICLLRAMNTNIIIQEDEISDCIWLPLEAVSSSLVINEFNKLAITSALRNHCMKIQGIDSIVHDLQMDGHISTASDFEYYL